VRCDEQRAARPSLPRTIMTAPATWQLTHTFPQLRCPPRLALGQWPTPVDTFRLHWEGRTTALWVKRDDRCSPLYGGNKVRKLELLLADASAKGHRTVWTVGAVGSNHCLATAIMAEHVGLSSNILHFPQPPSPVVTRNLCAIAATNANLDLAALPVMTANLLRHHIRNWLSVQAQKTYYIPAGGSSPLGALAFVEAAAELQRQIDAGLLPLPQRIYVAAGTCGTFAGLWLGCALLELPIEVIGVRVVDRVICHRRLVKNLAAQILGLLRDHHVRSPARELVRRPLRLLHDHFGRGYGQATPEGVAAIEAMAAAGGPQLEPTYTGKALAGALRDCALRPPKGPVLFWNTYNSRPLTTLDLAQCRSRVPSPYHPFLDTSPHP